MVTEPKILESRGVKKSYVQGTISTEVLHGVDARFVQGKTYAITGVSGSGKSTFMHLLAGLDTPDQGAVLFDGRPLSSFSQQEKEHFLNFSIGLAFQAPYLIQELSVIENVILKGMIAGTEKEHCIEQAQELLRRVGLEHKDQAHVSSLSGGQQQRVALARALFNKPAFFLADEPTGNLDHETAKLVIGVLLECQRDWSMGLIVSSHDPYVAQTMHEIFHMSDGVLKKTKG